MRIGVIDLLGKEPPKNGYSRFMRANNASVMPQVVAVWCEQEGHEVHMAYYSGAELVAGALPEELDLVFITAFSQAALLAYAMSASYRAQGVITVLGGPHARSYPEDAVQYFDYVVGMCDRELLRDILNDAEQHRPLGEYVSSTSMPTVLPGLRERWKFLEPAMQAAKVLRLVPVIGSLGCPYKCSFCIDSTVAYQPLEFEGLKDDLRFFQELNLPRSVAVWHDPNFGIRFDDYCRCREPRLCRSPGWRGPRGRMRRRRPEGEPHRSCFASSSLFGVSASIVCWPGVSGSGRDRATGRAGVGAAGPPMGSGRAARQRERGAIPRAVPRRGPWERKARVGVTGTPAGATSPCPAARRARSVRHHGSGPMPGRARGGAPAGATRPRDRPARCAARRRPWVRGRGPPGPAPAGAASGSSGSGRWPRRGWRSSGPPLRRGGHSRR